MRTSVIKMVLPVAAFMLASAGAIGTKINAASDKGTIVQGYYRPVAGQPCKMLRQCSNTSDILCKQGSVQAFALTGADDCSTQLFHSGS